jgi:membrane-associated protease RseP (regulator of RpoE activity)
MDQRLDQPGWSGPGEQQRPWQLPPPARVRPRLVTPPKTRPLVHIVLFLATFATTTMAGAAHAGANPFESLSAFLSGLPFSATLMLILLSHELGHYALALYHHVPTTLPYFIPGPPLLVGTFGAFIRMYGLPRSRQALFDVGAAGPWAGLVVAVPAVIVGLSWSEVRPLDSLHDGGLALGNSILFSTLSRLVLGVDPESATILLHPVALAGWFGIFVTFLNLLPVGQLDGGHVVYALFGRWHGRIARLFFVVVLAMGFLGWEGWFVWAAMLAFALGVQHPDTLDYDTPLDPRRKLAAWLTIGVFLLTFMPVPLSVVRKGPTEAAREMTRRSRPRTPPAPQDDTDAHGRHLQDIRLDGESWLAIGYPASA